PYIGAQTLGAIGGAVLADAMFGVPQGVSHLTRSTPHLWLGELVATPRLILLIFSLVRTQRAAYAAPAGGVYIGAASWFRSPTSSANPAATIARAFTDPSAGIAPASVPGFVIAQVVGAAIAVALILLFYPGPAAESSHEQESGLQRETVGARR